MLAADKINFDRGASKDFQYWSQVQVKEYNVPVPGVNDCEIWVASPCKELCIFVQLMFLCKCACIVYVFRKPKTTEVG